MYVTRRSEILLRAAGFGTVLFPLLRSRCLIRVGDLGWDTYWGYVLHMPAHLLSRWKDSN